MQMTKSMHRKHPRTQPFIDASETLYIQPKRTQHSRNKAATRDGSLIGLDTFASNPVFPAVDVQRIGSDQSLFGFTPDNRQISSGFSAKMLSRVPSLPFKSPRMETIISGRLFGADGRWKITGSGGGAEVTTMLAFWSNASCLSIFFINWRAPILGKTNKKEIQFFIFSHLKVNAVLPH